MNSWKLEWLRLVRTRRLLVLFAVFVIFGFICPILAKYLPDIISSSAGNSGDGIKIIVTRPPVAADGFAQYISNALQIGLLVVIIVAANSLAIDAKKSLSVFYRTRITSITRLFLPRFTTVTLTVVCAFIVGTLTAWYESTALLGHVNAHAVIIGGLFTSLYLVFCIATVALSASIVRGQLGAVGLSLGILFLSPVIGSFKSLGQWLPTTLSASMPALFSNQHAASYYFKSLSTTTILILVFLGVALLRLRTREVDN